MMNIEILGNRVLVKPVEEQGTILIADSAKTRPERGEVIAVGEGKLLDSGEFFPIRLKPGQNVLFSKYSANEVKLDGEKLLIVDRDSIYAVVPPLAVPSEEAA